MSLTVGTGPFGQRPGGEFNIELPRRKGLIYFEDSPRRIRARLGGETVVDSRHAKLLHEHGHLPVHYFPRAEVRMDLLEPSAKRTHCRVRCVGTSQPATDGGVATIGSVRTARRNGPADMDRRLLVLP